MVGPASAPVNAWIAVVDRRWGRRALAWVIALGALALALDFVPLFDLLGYDFAFAIGLGTALAGVDLGQGVVARWRAAPAARPPGAGTVLRLVGEALALTMATLALPLLLSLANALRVRNCSLGAGLAFFALLPVGTALYAAPAGVLAGLAAPRRGRPWALALPLLSVAWTLARLYRDPAVFAFDPFGGYFPGPIYDEALRPPLQLLLYRLVNLVWIGAAVALAAATVGRGLHPRRWRPVPVLVAAPLLLAALVLYGLEGPAGFHVRRADLERALDRTLRTEHFVLHYAAGAGKTRADLGLEAEDLEFRYQQLAGTLGVEPALPITVWEFPSADDKKALVGAGHTLYAKPWTREIFLHGERFPSTRLRHEMAHVFAGGFGDGLFGLALAWRWKGPLPMPRLAMGLVEGLAEAADAGDPDGATTIHQDAAAMMADGLAPPLEAVVGAGFSTLAGARAYTIAGSFCTFLLETRGPEPLRALYRSAGDFEAAYHAPLASLEAAWRQFLAGQPLSPRDRARARERFRRPAIFKKVCARELAARLAEARAVLRASPERAVRLLEATCRDDPHEPTFRLELARARALAGDGPGALAIVGRLGGDGDVTQPLRAQAAGLAAEIHARAGDFANAAADEARVLSLATEEADRRQALAKRRALDSPAARASLGRALYGDDGQAAGSDPVLTFFLMLDYARMFPADRLGPYLVGRQLLARDAAHALPYLRRACDEEASAPAPAGPGALAPEFVRECRRMTGEAGYRVGDFPRARAALSALAAEAEAEADRLRALDLRARVDWAAQRRHGEVGVEVGISDRPSPDGPSPDR